MCVCVVSVHLCAECVDERDWGVKSVVGQRKSVGRH